MSVTTILLGDSYPSQIINPETHPCVVRPSNNSKEELESLGRGDVQQVSLEKGWVFVRVPKSLFVRFSPGFSSCVDYSLQNLIIDSDLY